MFVSRIGCLLSYKQERKRKKGNPQKYDDFSNGKSLISTHTHLPRVDGIVHDLNPSFERSHLKQA